MCTICENRSGFSLPGILMRAGKGHRTFSPGDIVVLVGYGAIFGVLVALTVSFAMTYNYVVLALVSGITFHGVGIWLDHRDQKDIFWKGLYVALLCMTLAMTGILSVTMGKRSEAKEPKPQPPAVSTVAAR